MPKTYDQFASQYDAVMRPLERWFLTRLRTRTFNLLPPNARVLELGAGTGRNFAFYPAETSGVASEPSREMLKIAKDRKRPAAVRLVQNQGEELPFKSAAFDAAFATLVFCSVSSPAKTFAELRRVVRSGGTILLLEHVRPGGLLGLIFDLINLITVPLFEDHFNRQTADEARAAGLQVVKVEKSLLGVINLIVCRV
ncbi:MAG: class I SAM-dependent methyltransferase [Acidobacteriota bacterium]|nr:class I SAM-dependent methyltransferase [Acidobacteriota bacterium]